MARIKIEDLPKSMEIGRADMRKVVGGALFGNALYANAMWSNALQGNALWSNAIYGNSLTGSSTSESFRMVAQSPNPFATSNSQEDDN